MKLVSFFVRLSFQRPMEDAVVSPPMEDAVASTEDAVAAPMEDAVAPMEHAAALPPMADAAAEESKKDCVLELYEDIRDEIEENEKCVPRGFAPVDLDCSAPNFAIYSASTVPINDEFHWFHVAGFAIAPPPGCRDGTWIFDGASKKVHFVPAYFHKRSETKQRDVLQHLPVDEDALRAAGAVSAPTFRKLALRYALTKDQWLAIPPGSEVRLMSFDRNWEEYCLAVALNPRSEILESTHIFQDLVKLITPEADHLNFKMTDERTDSTISDCALKCRTTETKQVTLGGTPSSKACCQRASTATKQTGTICRETRWLVSRTVHSPLPRLTSYRQKVFWSNFVGPGRDP